MSKLTRWTIGCVIPLCLAIAGAVHAEVSQSQPQDSSLNTYRDVDGQVYFVLSLRPEVKETPAAKRDILVLVDTSASQTGRFREGSIEAVETIIAELQPGERVHVAAIDLQVVPMTKNFVAAESKQLTDAITNLRARTPLGATDLVAGIGSAVELFEDNGRAHSIVYIGDGMSRANLIATDELQPLVQKMVDHQVSINSYAIGVRRDIDLLAVLANNSGGSVFMDGDNITAQQAGHATLQLARGTVVWPTDVKWPDSVTEAFPTQVPPLRFDRDTIVIGSMVSAESLVLNANANVAGKVQTLNWSLNAVDSSKNDDYAMVPDLVSSARPNDGITLTLLGSEGFDLARKTYQNSSQNLSKLGKQALTRGDVEGGLSMLREALRRDPGNIEAKSLLKSNTAILKTSTKGVAKPAPQLLLAQADDIFGDENPLDVGDDDFFGDDGGGDVLPDEPTEVPEDLVAEDPTEEEMPFGDDPEPVAEAEPALEPSPTPVNPAIEPMPAPTPMPADNSPLQYGYNEGGYSIEPLQLGTADNLSDSDLLLNAEEERRLQEQILQKEVAQSLSTGRNAMRADPAATLETLKNLRESIMQSPDISSAVRADLLGRLEVGLRSASRQRLEKEKLDELARANLAELQAKQQFMAANARKFDEVQELANQISALLAEGRFQLAEEVALEMRERAPRMIAPQVALPEAGYTGNYRRIKDLFELKQRLFVDALYDVELSQVPFPDNTPIVYPDPEIWEELSERRLAKYSKADLGETGPAERRIYAALDEDTRVEATDEPISQVISLISERHNIPIVFDSAALADENVDPTSDPININVSNISLRSALRLMLNDLNLTYVVDNEVLNITSQTKAEETLVTKVYPVGDLVIPLGTLTQAGLGGGGGGLGGGGGGLGGGGGGFGGGGGGFGGGGGGFGGGGGGFGGGGGGGFGGGGGGGLFDVQDAIQLGKPKTATATTPVVEKKKKTTATKPFNVKQHDGESVDATWDRFFGKVANMDITIDQERQLFQRVRATVRDLATKRDITSVIAVIKSALRNGQFQPWMHQTLASAMRATGADKAEIERAYMSMVDLSSNSNEVIVVAKLLSNLGLDARAMQLYRDIASMNPVEPAPYIHAMEAAKRIDDTDGIRWACENILAQAWPEKHVHFFDQAVVTAKATVHDLRMAGKTAEADDLQTVLTDALSRDVVVRVTWTGDADIDMMVQEPSGTICSLKNLRTTNGGVMLGDALPNPDKKTIDGITETYVCPKGFNGDYKVLVRRIWGDVTAGKVNVEIATNVTTSGAGTLINQQIDLGEKDALLTFKLENGRREEQLEDRIVANAAARHIETNRAIVLAQQFDRAEDDRVSASSSLADLTSLRTRDPREAARVEAALRGRGAVGFMPQLTVLPEGTQMIAQAVISADRRYVRISTLPNFTRIADVQTFNFATGIAAAQDGGGGAGGQFGAGGAGGGAF